MAGIQGSPEAGIQGSPKIGIQEIPEVRIQRVSKAGVQGSQGLESKPTPGLGSKGTPRLNPRVPGTQEPQPSAGTLLPEPAEDTAPTMRDKCSQCHVLLPESFSVSDTKPHFACRRSQRGAGAGWELLGLSLRSWRGARSPAQQPPASVSTQSMAQPLPPPPSSSLCFFAAVLSSGSRLMSPAGQQHMSIVIPA